VTVGVNYMNFFK